MQNRVAELLAMCGTGASVLPPTELYNEGWLLRLVLDWFDQNRATSHELSFLPDARWYSQALLPSRFLPQRRGDDRAESFTRADGVIGHFSVSPGERGEARLLPTAKQFVVTEAKLSSSLSVGTKHAADFDQAARNVACMAHMLDAAHVDPAALERVGFYVLAPKHQIQSGVFANLVTRESISQKVAARVAQYQGQWDKWLASTFEPMLQRIHLSILSWESILALLPNDEEAAGIRQFYSLCLQFNPGRAERGRSDRKSALGA